MRKDKWTHADFEEMSWHDNHFHGFHVVAGEYGSGDLLFDVDYILEWLALESGETGFRIAPATLAFHDVTNLVVSIDYASPSAALGPFSADSIERMEEVRDRYVATVWHVNLNWPKGFIRFESTGFEQSLRAEPVIAKQQLLTAKERGDAPPLSVV
jgi:hypothetical protein